MRRWSQSLRSTIALRSTPALLAAGGVLFSVGLVVGWNQSSPWERSAQGQAAQPQVVAPASRRSPDPRKELYETLEREVAPLERQSRVLNVVAQLMRPTVFHIEADKVDRSNARQFGMIEEAGSGVLIELPSRPGESFILTNSHVIRGAKSEAIRLKSHDGRVFAPTKVWEDPPTDVAVLAIPTSGLPTARLGDSTTCQIGDFVLALGSPFGLRQSVTFGIISAKGRRDLELGDNVVKFQDFLQTDAAINPGNSGGPLVNLHGEVIGINTAIASSSGGSEGIGFSIPINMAVNIAQQLVETNGVLRAFLGVTLDSKFTAGKATDLGLPHPRGALVTQVRPNTPASAVGLAVGDVVVEFDGIPVEDDGHLINMVSLTKAGRTVPMLVWRDRQTVKLMVRLAERATADMPK